MLHLVRNATGLVGPGPLEATRKHVGLLELAASFALPVTEWDQNDHRSCLPGTPRAASASRMRRVFNLTVAQTLLHHTIIPLLGEETTSEVLGSFVFADKDDLQRLRGGGTPSPRASGVRAANVQHTPFGDAVRGARAGVGRVPRERLRSHPGRLGVPYESKLSDRTPRADA